METFQDGANTFFLLLGAAMVLAMHAGFAFFPRWARCARKTRSMP